MFSSPLSLCWVRNRVCSADNDACGGNERKRKVILEMPREKHLMIFMQPLWALFCGFFFFCFVLFSKLLSLSHQVFLFPLQDVESFSPRLHLSSLSPPAPEVSFSRRLRMHSSASGFLNWLFPAAARPHVTCANTCTATSSQRPHPLRQVPTRPGSSSPRRSLSWCEPRWSGQGRG